MMVTRDGYGRFHISEGQVLAVLQPAKATAILYEDGHRREVEVTRWVKPDNLPPVPVVAVGQNTEADVARAVLDALA